MNKEEEQQLKREAEELLKIKGNARAGSSLMADFIRKRHGQEGVKKVEEKMTEFLGYSYKFPEKRPKNWYPEAENILIEVIAKYLFNWKDKDIFALGQFHAVHSFTMRVLLRYFVSLDKIFKDAPKHWARQFDFSELEAVELNKNKRYAIFRIKGYKLHPVTSKFFAGYFYTLARCCLKSEKVFVEQTKSVFKGGSYDEYVIKW